VLDTFRILLAIALCWCLLALGVQVLRARGPGRHAYSRPRGSAARGVYYNFTAAMLPAHKESVRLHPGKFAIGLLLHLGVLLSLLAVVVTLAAPTTGFVVLGWLRLPAAVSTFAGLYLLLRRVRDPNLKVMSAPEDFFAVALSTGLVALVASLPATENARLFLLAYTATLLLYLPFGKLRHAVFFFVARADLGHRLGHRGVYPPPSQTK